MEMKHMDILNNVQAILKDRADQYGPAEACFDRISKLASISLNKPISRYDVAMILHCVKLGRLQDARANLDNYLDGINYLAFAGEFIRSEESVIIAAENDVAAAFRGNVVSDAVKTAEIGKDEKAKVEFTLPKVAVLSDDGVNII